MQSARFRRASLRVPPITVPNPHADLRQDISQGDTMHEDMPEAMHEHEAGDMDDMMDAFFANPPEAAAFTREEEAMRGLASTPLYEGAEMSKLRACLLLLNLQTKYGWSDASVTELFR